MEECELSPDETTNLTSNSTANITGNKEVYEQVYAVLYGWGLPSICLFGFIGNILNMIILACKQRRVNRANRKLRKSEHSANMGLIALAVADMIFCLSAFPSTFLPEDPVFPTRSALCVYGCYCHAVINIFIMTSTWITVAMSTERYLAICHPLKSRNVLSIRRTKVVIVLVYVFSALFNVPMFWRHKIVEQCVGNRTVNHTVYRITPVTLYNNVHVEHAYRASWAVVGNFIPLFLLLMFNFALMREIHQSYAMRKRMNSVTTSHQRSSDMDSNNRITITLVSIVLMFLILVAPSEVAKHVVYLVGGDLSQNYTYMTIEIITNVMQTINFSANFILYCIISPSFRRTMKELFCFQYQKLYKSDNSAERKFSWGLTSRAGSGMQLKRLSTGLSSNSTRINMNSTSLLNNLSPADCGVEQDR